MAGGASLRIDMVYWYIVGGAMRWIDCMHASEKNYVIVFSRTVFFERKVANMIFVTFMEKKSALGDT